MSGELREPLVRLLDALDAVAAEHEEVYDTHVREQMGAAIEQRLVANASQDGVPDTFGMFSAKGNQSVRAALVAYRGEAVPRADALNLDEEARRRAVWDGDAVSRNGTPVDEFLGWVD